MKYENQVKEKHQQFEKRHAKISIMLKNNIEERSEMGECTSRILVELVIELLLTVPENWSCVRVNLSALCYDVVYTRCVSELRYVTPCVFLLELYCATSL